MFNDDGSVSEVAAAAAFGRLARDMREIGRYEEFIEFLQERLCEAMEQEDEEEEDAEEEEAPAPPGFRQRAGAFVRALGNAGLQVAAIPVRVAAASVTAPPRALFAGLRVARAAVGGAARAAWAVLAPVIAALMQRRRR